MMGDFSRDGDHVSRSRRRARMERGFALEMQVALGDREYICFVSERIPHDACELFRSNLVRARRKADKHLAIRHKHIAPLKESGRLYAEHAGEMRSECFFEERLFALAPFPPKPTHDKAVLGNYR